MAVRAATRLAVPTALALIVTVSGIPDAVAVSHPSAPRSVAAKPGNTTVRVSWTAPLHNGGAPINSYQVQRATAATGPWSGVVKLAATTLAWTNTALSNGIRYYYRVRAHNSAGWSAPSSAVSAVPRTVPSAPESPAATSGDASAAVSWQAPASSGGAAIDKYQVQYSTDGATWVQLTTSDAQTQLTVNGLQNGTQFHFRVRAHNVAGWGPVSGEVLTIPGVPLPPTQVQAHSDASGAHVSWTPSATTSPAITGYDVEWSTDPSVLWNVAHVSSATTQYAISSSSYGTTYYFRVRAQNSTDFSTWSATTSAVIGLPPCAVHNLTAMYFGTPWNFATVSWDPSPCVAGGSPATHYLVERIVNEGTYATVADLDSSKTTYQDNNVARFNTYWYRITPYNQLGYGPGTEVKLVIN